MHVLRLPTTPERHLAPLASHPKHEARRTGLDRASLRMQPLFVKPIAMALRFIVPLEDGHDPLLQEISFYVFMLQPLAHWHGRPAGGLVVVSLPQHARPPLNV